jgi:very-short-patch-repair endonuclease
LSRTAPQLVFVSTFDGLALMRAPPRNHSRAMQSIEVFLRFHHGAARFSTLTANGFSRGHIDRAVKDGAVQRPSPGTYALHDAPAELLFAAERGVSLTCISAARVLGWWALQEPPLVHVTADRAMSLPGAVVHRGPRTAKRLIATPLQIIDSAFRCLPPLSALVLAECAVSSHYVGVPALERHFSGPKDWKVRQLIREIPLRTASPLEVCARFHLRAAGLAVETEVHIPEVGRVDLAIEGRLLVEIDGYEFHSSREHYRKDRNRWNAATAAGWKTLRITAEMVLHDPEGLVLLVRGALAR